MKLQGKAIGLIILSANLLLLVVACVSQKPAIGTAEPPIPTGDAIPVTDYLIQPGDELDIKSFYTPEINETVIVRPDGKISLLLVDDVMAAGLTPGQLDSTLTQQYAHELNDPDLTVIVKNFAGRQIYVGGEVRQEGLVQLHTAMNPLQAVLAAGGLKESANPQHAVVIRKSLDNTPRAIPIDLTRAINGTTEEALTLLYPQDIVYVPATAITRVNRFVDQYVRQLILFQGLSFGFNYDLNPTD